MTSTEKVKFNYYKILAWLIAQNICGKCNEDRNGSECEKCTRWMAKHAAGKNKNLNKKGGKKNGKLY